jgi:hypothetical protein
MNSRTVLIVGTIWLALSGCSSGSSDASAPSTQAAGGTSSAAGGSQNQSSTCGGTADKVKQHLAGPEIQTVVMMGQCTLVSIKTTLADDDTATAKQLCDSAAEVAYSADTNSIQVLGASTKELAIGISKAKCLTSS